MWILKTILVRTQIDVMSTYQKLLPSSRTHMFVMNVGRNMNAKDAASEVSQK